MNDLTIVVFCNKMDFFLTRICIASIRYFYKDIKILLVKDELNGRFSTKEIEEKFKVELYDCGRKIFGWAASKTFFLLQAIDDQKYLLLDSDIVFIEPFLERICADLTESTFVVSADLYGDIYTSHVNETYFNVNYIKNFDPTYQYPGFFFNTGQLLITGGKIESSHLSDFFDATHFPYWRRLDIFPMVDQSVYNYVFPKLDRQGILELRPQKFMIWSEGPEVKELNLKEVISKEAKGGLIHWAGAKRTPVINQMTRSDILGFYQKIYYENIFLGTLKIEVRKALFIYHSYFLRVKRKVSKVLNSNHLN